MYPCRTPARRGDGDRDGQAAVIAGKGGDGAVVDRGDGRDDGQAEPEAVMGCAVAEPLERLEDAAGLHGADDRPGIGHGQLAADRHGAGADPDVAGRDVVPDRVVDQVRDEVLGQHRIARYHGGLQRGMHPPVAHLGRVKHVFGGRGQVDLLMNGEPALVAREDEQRADEVLGVIDRGADVGRHGAQVAGRAVRVAQHDVDGGAHDGERGAQFMGGVGDEPLLALERGLKPAEHLVERLGQLAQFVAGTGRRDPRRQVVFGRGAGGRGDLVHRAQRPPGEDPAEDRGEGDDHGQRDQRVLQQMRQGKVTLALRALLLEVRGALSQDDRIGMDAYFRGPALRREPGQVSRGRRLPALPWTCPCAGNRATRA